MYYHIQVTGYRDLRMAIFDFGLGCNGFPYMSLYTVTIKKYFFKGANSDAICVASHTIKKFATKYFIQHDFA